MDDNKDKNICEMVSELLELAAPYEVAEIPLNTFSIILCLLLLEGGDVYNKVQHAIEMIENQVAKLFETKPHLAGKGTKSGKHLMARDQDKVEELLIETLEIIEGQKTNPSVIALAAVIGTIIYVTKNPQKVKARVIDFMESQAVNLVDAFSKEPSETD